MERIAYWLRDNAPDGWAFPIMSFIIWLCVCAAWGAIWGFVFFDWDWIYTRGWGRFWVVWITLFIAFSGRNKS